MALRGTTPSAASAVAMASPIPRWSPFRPRVWRGPPPRFISRLARPRALSLRHGHSRGRIAGIPLLSTARTLRQKRMAIAHDGTLWASRVIIRDLPHPYESGRTEKVAALLVR